MDMIREFENGPCTQGDLATKYGVGRSSVSEILKKKDFYKDQYLKNSNVKTIRFSSSSKFGGINEILFDWFKQARAKNMPITGPLLQEKAMQYASELGFSEFKASNGWLENWKKKFAVKFYKICGESGDVNESSVLEFKTKAELITKEYPRENVFNCDETGLFFRAVSDKSLSVKGDQCKGGKLSKERLTVMLACSATGEKMKPLVIGKSYKPRCFKNIKTENLPVVWRSNKKAWMTEETFLDWVSTLNKDMKRQKRKIVLFLDNATSHSKTLNLSHVTLQYLPPNTTSKLQPLDLGIIRAFKARYRKLLSSHIVANIEKCETVTELTKALTVLDAVHWISSSWKATKPSTISKCFRDSGIIGDNPVEAGENVNVDDVIDEDVDEHNSEDDDDDDVPLADLVRRKKIDMPSSDVMFEFENGIPTEETYSGDWEKRLLEDLNEQRNQEAVPPESDSDSDVEAQTKSNLTHADIKKMILDIREFGLQKDDRFLGPAQELSDLVDKCILQKQAEKKQSTLDAFFHAD